jgi:hypothetical protein
MARVLPVILLTLLVLPSTARTQARPDFSGMWKMDPSRSESAMQSEPIGPVTLVITQTPIALRIDTTRVDGTSTVTYTLGGSENKIPTGTARTHWEGTTLVTEATHDVKGQTVTTKTSRSLNAADELLVETILVVQHGYTLRGTPNWGAAKDVYTRQHP